MRALPRAAQRAAGSRRAPSADAAGLERGRAAEPLRRLRPAFGRGARALARRRGCRRRAAGRLCRRGHRVLPGRPRLPSRPGTSCLSPYLAAGVLSAGRARAQAANLGELDSGKAGIATWINELLWREFYQHLLAAYPELSMHRPMKPETAHVPWRDAPEDLLAWQEGRTGIPIVDAAMRQLLALGWMHNRLRMVTAMFLSKNLLIDWRLGEAWFMAHLVDGDRPPTTAAGNGARPPAPTRCPTSACSIRCRNRASSIRTACSCANGCPSWRTCPATPSTTPARWSARPPATRAHRGPGRQPAARAGSVRQSAARLNRRASRASSRVRGAPIPRRRDAPLPRTQSRPSHHATPRSAHLRFA